VEVSYSIESAECARLIAECLVVQLFNMIQKAQTASEHAEVAKVALRGSGKPTLPAPDFNSNSKAKGKKQDNTIGRVKDGLCASGSSVVRYTDIYLFTQIMSTRTPSWKQFVLAE